MTPDPDVARLVEDAVHRERRPMKQVINDALRQALRRPSEPQGHFTVDVHESAVLPGLDPVGFNRLAAQIEDAAIIATARKTS